MRHQGTPAGGPIMTSGRYPGKEKLPTINTPRQARMTLSLKTVTECDADHIYLQHRPAAAAPESKRSPPRVTRQLNTAKTACASRSTRRTDQPVRAQAKSPTARAVGLFYFGVAPTI